MTSAVGTACRDAEKKGANVTAERGTGPERDRPLRSWRSIHYANQNTSNSKMPLSRARLKKTTSSPSPSRSLRPALTRSGAWRGPARWRHWQRCPHCRSRRRRGAADKPQRTASGRRLPRWRLRLSPQRLFSLDHTLQDVALIRRDSPGRELLPRRHLHPAGLVAPEKTLLLDQPPGDAAGGRLRLGSVARAVPARRKLAKVGLHRRPHEKLRPEASPAPGLPAPQSTSALKVIS